MTSPGLVERYAALAGALGTAVKIVEPGELGPLLVQFLRESGVKKVALSPEGWPPGLLDEVTSALSEAGAETVSPVENAPGLFEFDRAAMEDAGVGISFSGNFLASAGAMAFYSGPGYFTASSLLPPVSLAISLSSGALEGLSELLAEKGGNMPSRLVLVAGPSRTGDIEASMTTCVHGPGRVHHWIIAGGGCNV